MASGGAPRLVRPGKKIKNVPVSGLPGPYFDLFSGVPNLNTLSHKHRIPTKNKCVPPYSGRTEIYEITFYKAW